MANGLARPGTAQKGWAGTARRVTRAVPRQVSCLTNGLDTAYWAIFWAGPAREARPIQRARLAQGP
jgi:hypothetical protein